MMSDEDAGGLQKAKKIPAVPMWSMCERINYAILVLLLIFAPLAMMQSPYSAFYPGEEDYWADEPPASSQVDGIRSEMALGAFCVAACSCALFVTFPISLMATSVRRAWSYENLSRIWLFGCETLTVVWIAWRTYPYWLHGVLSIHWGWHSAALGTINSISIMDGFWDFWVLSSLLLYPVMLFVFCWVLVAACIYAWRREYVFMGRCLFLVLVIIGSVLCAPGFVDWALD